MERSLDGFGLLAYIHNMASCWPIVGSRTINSPNNSALFLPNYLDPPSIPKKYIIMLINLVFYPGLPHNLSTFTISGWVGASLAVRDPGHQLHRSPGSLRDENWAMDDHPAVARGGDWRWDEAGIFHHFSIAEVMFTTSTLEMVENQF